MQLLALVTFILFLSTQIAVPALPRLSAELGANPQEMAAVLSSALMTLVALQFFSGALADRYGRRAMLVVGAALRRLTSLLCAFAMHWEWLLALRVRRKFRKDGRARSSVYCEAVKDCRLSSHPASAGGYHCTHCARRL
jgi:DHA1 family bicyclomycin/chloramphenicol resistance-like MFS transporter